MAFFLSDSSTPYFCGSNYKNINSKKKTMSYSFFSSSDTLSSKRSQLQQGRQNSLEAMQLIKENSEILGRFCKRQDTRHNERTSPQPSPTDFKESPSTDFKESSSTDFKETSSTVFKDSQGTSPRGSYVVQSSPANKPITFNPFPNRQKKKPKEVGLKLGLYTTK